MSIISTTGAGACIRRSPRSRRLLRLFPAELDRVEELLGLAAPLRDRQAKLVLADMEDPRGPVANDPLLRFYAAHAFRLRGHNVLELFTPALLRSQSADGSWSSGTDRHAVHAGDAFLTALNALTLTSAWRFAG